jgi:hypothetical protein
MIFEAMRGKWPSAQGARCPIERCGRQWLKYPTYSAKTFCRWRSLKMNTWSRHSVLTYLTQRSAIALARGDLKGVRA